MTYRIVHKTTYSYSHPVSIGNHVAYLTPRSQRSQVCKAHELLITPRAAATSEWYDYFGNAVSFFSVQNPHSELCIEARSVVIVEGERNQWPEYSPAWDRTAKAMPTDLTPEGLDAYQFVFESPRIRPSVDFAAYAEPCFPPNHPLADAVLELTEKIHKDFRFDSKATNVRTFPEEVLLNRRGVCQDFAHLQVACLRSLGLAARYVSGYLRTYPPPGRARLIGADASHAWVSFYCPGTGWLDVDPTNNLIPSDGHVTLAWGRDYGDLSPVRGVILGGRDHKLQVGVGMEPID